MNTRIITIGREFGSGGRSIGKAVAEALGWDYYDRELVRHVAEETGFAEQYIEETGEFAPSKSRLAYALLSGRTAGYERNERFGLSLDSAA